MLYPILAIIAGLIVLTLSTDKFINAAASIASRLNVSPFLIGLTVVAFGTSAPEMIVSTIAAYNGSPELAIGNVFGSNIANIGLVMGITALIAPLPFEKSILKKELFFLLALTVIIGGLVLDFDLSLGDSIILVALLVLFISLLMQWQNPEDGIEDVEIDESMAKSIFWLIIGLALLLASSRVLVWGAVSMAEILGISETIIGLTIVAIGTSLPELAATVGSALKNKPGMAVGNVIGSNIMNLLVVLPIPALFGTVVLQPELVWRDYMMVLGIAVLFFLLSMVFKPFINRISGTLLLVAYITYTAYLVYLIA